MYFLEKWTPEIPCLEGECVLGVGNYSWWAVKIIGITFFGKGSNLLCLYLFNHYNNSQ